VLEKAFANLGLNEKIFREKAYCSLKTAIKSKKSRSLNAKGDVFIK
jgi:hypothetical protein